MGSHVRNSRRSLIDKELRSSLKRETIKEQLDEIL